MQGRCKAGKPEVCVRSTFRVIGGLPPSLPPSLLLGVFSDATCGRCGGRGGASAEPCRREQEMQSGSEAHTEIGKECRARGSAPNEGAWADGFRLRKGYDSWL